MEESTCRRYLFDEFTVDLARARLLRGGKQVRLRPKAFDVLRYLVENRGRLATKDELIGALWPNVIVTDDSLVKCVQEVRDALEDKQRRYIKTVPKRGYVFDAPVVGEPEDSGMAPVTNGGPADDEGSGAQDAAPATRGPAAARSKVAWIAPAVLAAMAAAGLGTHYLLGGDARRDVLAQRPANVQSVAVLPFVSISPDSGQDYFSDGISEELLKALANIPGLRVPSRTSSFVFKDTKTDLRTIAAALNVDHVLEGSVRKAGDQVRITAQLIEVSTDSHLWSETYDRELTNIFAIQDEIARNVAEALQVTLLTDQLPAQTGSRTASRDAHDAYLRGLHYASTLRSEDFFRARASFHHATELDSQYAAAHAELANSVLTAQAYGVMDRDEALSEAESAIAEALRLDPQLADAYVARGRLSMVKGDIAASEVDYRRAIEIKPSFARAYGDLFYALGAANRLREAVAALDKALELDPLNASFNWSRGNVWLAHGDREQAVRAYQRAVAFEPSQPNGYTGLADAAAMSGRVAEALAWYLKGLEQDPGHVHIMSIIGFIYMSLGDPGRAQLWFDEAAGLYPDGSLRRFFREFTPLVIRNEDPARLLEELRGIPSGQFPGLGSRVFRKAALQTGNLPGIEAFYREHWPELFEPEPRVGANNFDIAPEVAWILRAHGDHQAAATLLGQALDVFEDPARTSIYPPEWARVMFEIEVLALQERNAEALAALRRVIDDGWRWDWWQIERDPTLTSISGEPEFIAMLAEVKAAVAAQLEQVRAMERDGEINARPAAGARHRQ